MKKIFPLIIVLAIIISTLMIILQNNLHEKNNDYFKFEINFDKNNLDKIEGMSSLFNVYNEKNNYYIENNQQIHNKVLFGLKDENKELYQELGYTGEQNTVVIYPIFTSSAYEEPGFYNYYKSECDFSCLTVPIKNFLRTEMGGNAVQILKLLNYNFLSDIQIDQNPELLKNYDKVILLHNEYVTKSMFDTITNHNKVIYLYPNALYAEIETNYEENTITLVKGHGFPEEEIKNGYDWEFDNTHPFEFDIECKNWEFYEITNGHMLNCYPELLIFQNEELLRKLKEI